MPYERNSRAAPRTAILYSLAVKRGIEKSIALKLTVRKR